MGFEALSPYTLPNVIEVSEGIPYIDMTKWDHQKLYELKGQIVYLGLRNYRIGYACIPKRRFQHGAASQRCFSKHFPEKEIHTERSFYQNMNKFIRLDINNKWIDSLSGGKNLLIRKDHMDGLLKRNELLQEK